MGEDAGRGQRASRGLGPATGALQHIGGGRPARQLDELGTKVLLKGLADPRGARCELIVDIGRHVSHGDRGHAIILMLGAAICKQASGRPLSRG
jgi:hypothetical protein